MMVIKMIINRILPARIALVVLGALLGVSCVTEVSETPAVKYSDTAVISVYDPETVIAAESSFAWLPEAVRYYQDERISDSDLRTLIEAEIVSNLKTRQMNFVDSVNAAQYAIAYTAALNSSLDDSTIVRRYGLSPGNARVPENDANVEKGSLIIYVYNNKTEQIIWRSAAQAGVHFDLPAEQRKQRLARVVAEMFQSFPVSR
jgi:hypothetical protein